MVKAAVLGAAGQIGSPLSLLLKCSNLLTDLSLYDVVQAPGVAVDLNHIDTVTKVTGYLPADDGLEKALKDANIVIIPAGIARKPGMTRDDLFKTNAGVIRDLITAVARFCPTAYVLIITNPVNSTLPIAVEVLKSHGVLNPRKVLGVTTLDVVRASTFLAQSSNADPQMFKIPVVGGHSGSTILPLFSQCVPPFTLDQEQLEALTYRVQFGGDEIVQAKAGAGSATTCMAYATFRLVKALLTASNGCASVREEAYVYLPGVPGGESIAKEVGVDYFGVPLSFGKDGVTMAHEVGELSNYEKKLFGIALEQLNKDVQKGLDYVS